MLWLALHFPRLPMEVFAAAGDAFVVLQDNRICYRNRAAAEFGIACGSTLATAHSIYPGLRHKQRDQQAEQQRLSELADTLYRFSSHVSIQSPDCVLLEIGASLKLFNDHAALSRQASELCTALGYDTVARVAKTPWAALALARSRQHRLPDVPLTDAGLELAGIAPNIVERFANMGIYTLGPLLQLPDKALGKRFGKILLHYLQQLTGQMPDPRQAITPAPDFQRAAHLLQPITNKADLHEHTASPMQKLARELEHWLIARQLGSEQLLWRLHSHNREVARLPVNFASARQNSHDFLHISRLRMEQTELPAEVLSITLQARRLQPWQGSSHGLFNTLDAQKGQLMGELIDEFTARLGPDACQGIQSRPQHAPEQAWCGVAPRRLLCAASAAEDGHSRFPPDITKRPLWLFDPPRRVNRTDLDLLHGPERIQSQWWQTETVSRDYYVARHRLGAQCWAYVDAHEQWYLHGYFG